jgi:hypothetical protein
MRVLRFPRDALPPLTCQIIHIIVTPDWKNTIFPHGAHAFTGGHGSAVVLLAGWPETADAFAEVFSHLSHHHRVYASIP